MSSIHVAPSPGASVLRRVNLTLAAGRPLPFEVKAHGRTTYGYVLSSNQSNVKAQALNCASETRSETIRIYEIRLVLDVSPQYHAQLLVFV